MNKTTAQIILNLTTIDCILCNEKFRTRYLLRTHLKREHTDIDAEKLIKRII